MIHKGDVVLVRTSITGRKTKVKALFVNYKNGWFTGMIHTPHGDYTEAFWIRDMDDPNKEESQRKHSQYMFEDDPDSWLSEWSEDKYGK